MSEKIEKVKKEKKDKSVKDLQVISMPDEQKPESDAIKKLVRDTTEGNHSVEEGLKAWEESFKSAATAGKPDQALVNHWRALKYLHKLQIRVTSEDAAASPASSSSSSSSKKTEGQKIAASTTLLTRDHVRAALQPPALDRTKSPSKARSGSPSSKDRSDSPSGKRSKSPGKKDKESAVKKPANPLIKELSALTFTKGDSIDTIKEFDGATVQALKKNTVFHNWGKTIENTPKYTFEPKTRTGVCNIVKWAAAHGKTVRAAGYRHTWSSLYGSDDQVLVSMIPVKVAEDTHVISPFPRVDPNDDDLEGIRLLKEDGDHAYVRVGSSTSNDQFRVWCLQKYDWTLPMSVDLVEITFGGSTQPMCHGTGINHPTMADLITEIEFVNAKGDLQTVNDPEQLRAAAGALGVLGVVTAMTIKVERMSYANMKPLKIQTMLAIPPPAGWDVPPELQINPQPSQLAGAQKAFEHQVAKDFYNEWFWFPFQDKVFINCWHNDGDKAKSKNLADCKALFQNVQGILGSVTNSVLGFLQGDGEFMTKFVSWTAMQVLPDLTNAKEPEVTPVIEAYYFRRGLHNMPMWDMELIIPIPARADKPEKPDYTVINKAWWACINKTYDYSRKKKYPLRLGLAMHIIDASNLIMAPEHGNKEGTGTHRTFGSVSINISTVPQTPQKLWQAFCQDIADSWNSYTHPDGTPLNVRCHWVKEWEFLKYKGVPFVDHYRKVAYKERIPEFIGQLEKIAEVGGYTVKDLRARFTNPLVESIVFHE